MTRHDAIRFLSNSKSFILSLAIWGILFCLHCFYPSLGIFSAWAPATFLLFILDYFKIWHLSYDLNIIVFITAALIFTVAYSYILCRLIEKQKLFKVFLPTLLILIFAGAVYFYINSITYSNWTYTQEVQMRMGCPESPYTPSYADYKKEIIIPHILAGGMCGLHAAITLVGIIAIGKLSFARIQKWRQNKKNRPDKTEK